MNFWNFELKFWNSLSILVEYSLSLKVKFLLNDPKLIVSGRHADIYLRAMLRVFMQRPATLTVSFLWYVVKFSRAVQCVNGLHRSSSTLPERNALGRCVKCVYASARPSIPSLYYQTLQLPIGSAGSEFSRRTSLRPHSASPAFFSKCRSGLTPFEWMMERNLFREYDKRWMAVFFVVATAGWVTTDYYLYFTYED